MFDKSILNENEIDFICHIYVLLNVLASDVFDFGVASATIPIYGRLCTVASRGFDVAVDNHCLCSSK